MIVPERTSFTSIIRKLCEDIEAEVTALLKKALPSIATNTSSPGGRADPLRTQFQRTFQEINRAVIQTLTSRLPALINLQQQTNDREEDLLYELQQLRERHRKIYSQFQTLQLENDRLKVEAVALSDSYQQLVGSYEEMKYKYHQLQETRTGGGQHGGYHQRLAELNLLSRDSNTNSVQSDRSPPPEPTPNSYRNSPQILVEQRELFLQSIRDSQHQIVSFRQQIEQLESQREAHLAEIQSLSQLLAGQKERSDRFDREMVGLLNRNQELKLEVLEERQRAGRDRQEVEGMGGVIREERERMQQIGKEKEALGEQLLQVKREQAQLKLQNSQLRENIVVIQGRQRQLKTKVSDCKRENEQLRAQLQKLMARMHQATSSLELRKQQQSLHLRHELQQYRSRTLLLEHQSKTTHSDKIHEISRMHKEITAKLQQKIVLLEKGGKEKREKIGQLKFQVERLYEALQGQVEKEYKAVAREKELNEKIAALEGRVRIAEEKAHRAQEELRKTEQHSKSIKQQSSKMGQRLKKATDLLSKLRSSTLPSLREQAHSLKLLSQHLSSMLAMQRDQTAFLLSSKQDSFRQNMDQFLLQRTLTKQQVTLSHQNEIVRWKENCRNYEERYDQLKGTFQMLEDKYNKMEAAHAEVLRSHAEREALLHEENERRKTEHASTLRTVQKLKEKCRQVEQYYKLVDELSKENLVLKGKLDSVSAFSFKSPERQQSYPHPHPSPLDSTSKRNKFTPSSQDPLARFNRTSANSFPLRREEISVNDLTAKAEFQKQRLQAARREYNMLNRPES